MTAKTRILVVDNYDSFVFNLVQYLQQLGAECTVLRNDEVQANAASDYDGVLISPGPGTPEEAGVSIAMIEYCAEKKFHFSVSVLATKQSLLHLVQRYLAHLSYFMEKLRKYITLVRESLVRCQHHLPQRVITHSR